MKKSFLTVGFILVIALSAFSQKLTIPAVVTAAFYNKYPDASNVRWSKENAKEFEAEFKVNGNALSANFTSDGRWVETETLINTSELPAAVVASINKKYPGAVIISAEKLEEPGSKLLYETVVKVKGKKKTLEMKQDGSMAK